MVTNAFVQDNSPGHALTELARLRRFTGAPSEFWPAYLAACATLAGACKGTLILRDPSKPDAWKKLGDWSGNGHTDRSILTFNQSLADIATRAGNDGSAILPLDQSATGATQNLAVGVRLPLSKPDDICVAAFLLLNTTAEQANEALLRLQLASDVPSSYLLTHTAGQARVDVDKFAASLDLLAVVNSEKRFLSGTLALCNGLATRFQCDRVSLGWLEKGYIRLKSMSRTERFDKNMAAVKSLETAMEESLDQDDEIVFPAPAGSSNVTRDHEKFTKEQGAGNICSVPLRLDGKPVAVITLERQSRPFSASELQQFRLCADQVGRRLADLKQQDRWIGARLASGAREKAASLLGPEHTWAKVAAIVAAIGMIVLFFVPFEYRVEGNFILRSDDVSFVTGPFDGYIKQVNVRPGDQVKAGDLLVQLETDDLLLEESAALAEQNRHLREAEKARASNALAEMQIAKALADQARARLDLVRYRINQAAIRAPFDGVVVEGDLRQRIGSPIKQGDALLRIARVDTLYVEAEVNQRDVHEVINRTEGEIAFVTQPDLTYPVKIERVEPAAFPKDGENIFLVRCSLAGSVQPWWRPGMSGLCKINAGERSLYWILTHRTVDFLRLALWW